MCEQLKRRNVRRLALFYGATASCLSSDSSILPQHDRPPSRPRRQQKELSRTANVAGTLPSWRFTRSLIVTALRPCFSVSGTCSMKCRADTMPPSGSNAQLDGPFGATTTPSRLNPTRVPGDSLIQSTVNTMPLNESSFSTRKECLFHSCEYLVIMGI
ncbi:hypothetical protein EJB05_24636, partial [Eragrostis curvula]